MCGGGGGRLASFASITELQSLNGQDIRFKVTAVSLHSRNFVPHWVKCCSASLVVPGFLPLEAEYLPMINEV